MTNRSPATDLNPYAPSVVAEPYDRREREAPSELGLWHDGKFVVMHVEATWPASCVKTGLPAVGSHTVKIVRMVPESWWRREEIDIPVPLGSRWCWLVKRFRWAVFAAGCPLIPGALLLLTWRPVAFPAALMGVATVGSFVAIAIFGTFDHVLQFKRSWGNYVWLSGAGKRFLAQLPPWPPG
jgi:hypothetical protein